MRRRLELDYSLGYGWLSPWLDGLREGRVVASCCSVCGDVHFPPLRACPNCRTLADGWQPLSGGATILFRTIGTDGDFALVRFDGASAAAVVRAQALPAGAKRARLAPCPTDPPVLFIIAEPET